MMTSLKMCIECPHRKEHELGEEIVLWPGNKVHECHMHTGDCVGHQLQKTKISLGIICVEDYDMILTSENLYELRLPHQTIPLKVLTN